MTLSFLTSGWNESLGGSQSIFRRLTNINSERKQKLLQCTLVLYRLPSLQASIAAVGAVLRGADEHFDEVVVQRVVELALEAPLELMVVEVAGMEIEVIGVDRDGCVFESDDEFHSFA